jgi:hypothetical protein
MTAGAALGIGQVHADPGDQSARELAETSSLGDIPGSLPSDPKWVAVDTAGHRLFVSLGGDVHQILVYRY